MVRIGPWVVSRMVFNHFGHAKLSQGCGKHGLLGGRPRNLSTTVNFGRDRPGVVTMYVCGPTVYDMAHLGHARTYVQFDAIRRILEDVHGVQVGYFMNVTDVDDKILNRARELGVDWRQHAEKFKNDFFQDMALLGVRQPVFAPHATSYVDSIVLHIAKLMEKGLAYQGERTGSVYFDTAAFDQATGVETKYGALDPSRRNDNPTELENETEDEINGDKRDVKDFALWKAVRSDDDGTTTWDSPWGKGRPGWHAECSAMIHETAGTIRKDGRLDIHGGGIDLRFPHHENERAQSQALQDCSCCDGGSAKIWTNMFLHTGHLHIKGRKMSKSLKNFITVKELFQGSEDFPALSPRQARLLFLGVKYSSPMELSRDQMVQAIRLDKTIKEFFINVKSLCANNAVRSDLKWNEDDTRLLNRADEIHSEVTESLKNDFNIPKALSLLQAMISETNIYINSTGASGAKTGLLQQIARQVSNVLETFGIGVFDGVPGYHDTQGASSGSDSKQDPKALIELLVNFRSDVRQAARGKDMKKLFQICDEIRDAELPKLGVRVNDRGDKSTWAIIEDE